MIKFPTEYGIGELRGDQVAAHVCYIHAGIGGLSADHQGRNVPSGRLLVCLQRYPRATHAEFVEGGNFNLPPDD